MSNSKAEIILGKILQATMISGYNHATVLQALALQSFLYKKGYKCVLLVRKRANLHRDIRFGKLLVLATRAILHPIIFKKIFLSYKLALISGISDKSKEYFNNFISTNLSLEQVTYLQAKTKAYSSEVIATICGSDQIWKGDDLYLDPLYFLRFAPNFKKIAFAPSFGIKTIPNYNLKAIKKRLDGFQFLSARENEGVEIIKQVTGRDDAQQVCDPVFLLNAKEWEEFACADLINGKYILAYFLDKPVKNFGLMIDALKKKQPDLKIVGLGPGVNSKEVDFYQKDAGPEHFLSLISRAEYVITDSYHGSAFSIIFEKQFLALPRNYGAASNQSSRLLSMLTMLNCKENYMDYEPKEIPILNYNIANELKEKMVHYSKEYLINSILGVIKYGKH